jgi:ATP-dependent Clp protease ATP-binding subunit ClpC
MDQFRLHSSTQLAWALANLEACRARSEVIAPAHFLLAILKLVDDAFHQDAQHLRLSKASLEELKELIPAARKLTGLDDAAITAARRGLRRMTGGLEEPDQTRVLHRSPESRELFRRATEQAISDGEAELTILHLLGRLRADLPAVAEPFFEHTTVLARPAAASIHCFDGGRDLTALAVSGRLAPVVGRKREMTALVRYLQRTTKRNVLLIGEAGVGKTAVVEGLAQYIASENAPEFLKSLRIVQINVADLVAGAKYRGDMERRLNRIIEEAIADPNLVLFIDEIHLVMSTGGVPLDIANILKPALARDDFRCIGATTTDEYERHIKGDTAFARRFQLVRVSEPSIDEAMVICESWARRIEQRQQVVFMPEAVEAVVNLSANLMGGRALPDKAIDLLENAAAYVKISTLSPRPMATSKEPVCVGRSDIEAVLREQYGVAVTADEVFDPDRIRASLLRDLVGQDTAIDQVVETLAALRVRSQATTRPLGVLLLTGPTGVGKTFTAECLARSLFGDDRHLCRFNMSEFKEAHQFNRLIGAPVGFIGSETQGALFRHVESHPQGVILLDEMEKAHPEVQDYFLQIFDKGEARDSRGRLADFRRHLFVLTCNATGATEAGPLGFHDGNTATANGTDVALARHFRPEFLGRLDGVIEFRALDNTDFCLLFDRAWKELQAQHDGKLVVSDEVRTAICRACATAGDGVRGFQRRMEREVIAPLMRRVSLHPKTGALALTWDGKNLHWKEADG